MCKNRRYAILMITWLLLAVSIMACTSAKPKPEGKSPTVLNLKDPSGAIDRFTLENGLEVLVVQRKTVPLVTILTAVKNGAMAESPEYDGLSHLYEHMFFKGNTVLPDQQSYMRRTRELGMSFNGSTSTESVQYYFTLPKENLQEGLTFMRDALVSPIFEEGELRREVSVVLNEYDRNESSPVFYLHQAMTKALFSKYPSRKNVIGERDVISSVTREKMQTVKNRYYVPNNSLLIVSGDVTASQVKAMVEPLFREWSQTDDPYIKHPVPTHPPLTKDGSFIVERPFQNVILQFGWQGPSVSEDPIATYAADVFSYILQQRASGFQKRLVDSGLLLGASFSYFTQRHVGPIYLTGFTSPQRAAEALTAIREEFPRFVQPDYFSEQELENAKRMLAIESVYSFERSSTIAQELGFWWCVADTDYRLNYIKNVESVTIADIERYLNRYVIDQPKILGILTASEYRASIEAAMASAQDEKEVRP